MIGTLVTNSVYRYFLKHGYSQETFLPHVLFNVDSIRATIATRGADTHLRSMIDNDILRLEDATLQLKRQRNSCTPILRLPPEVLAKIAERLIVIWPAKSRPAHPSVTDQFSLGWVRLSHVCSGLRSVLLNCRHIWARNISDIPLQPEAVLARCGDTPLDLTLRSTSTQDITAFALKHLARARRIDFQEDSLQIQNGVLVGRFSPAIKPSLFSQSTFPHLESLTLSTRANDASTTRPDGDLNLPSMIAPHLRFLSLFDFMIPFRPDTLTSLTLEFCRMRPLSNQGLFNLLRRCVRLEELTLTTYEEVQSVDQEKPGDLIMLPRLKQIDITDSSDMCMGLLLSLSAPLLVETSIYVPSVPESQLLLSVMLPYLQTATSGVTGISLFDYTSCKFDGTEERGHTTLVFYVLHHGGTAPRAWTGPFARDHRPKLSIEFTTMDISPPHFRDSLDAAANLMDCTRITTVEIGCFYEYAPAAWSASLARFSHVRTLFLNGPQHIRTLLSLVVSVSPQGESVVIMPLLRTIWLSELSVQSSDVRAHISDVFEEHVIGYRQFLDIFSSRARVGCPIECLRIDQLNIKPDIDRLSFLSHLCGLVQTLQYTG